MCPKCKYVGLNEIHLVLNFGTGTNPRNEESGEKPDLHFKGGALPRKWCIAEEKVIEMTPPKMRFPGVL